MGDVIQFRPRKTPAPPATTQHLHTAARRGDPRAAALAADQADQERTRYAAAAKRQREEKALEHGTPVPGRITLALDAGGHDGPGVDIACGAVEPAVDRWEQGIEVPTAEQVRLLAALTGYPVLFFYEPLEPGPLYGMGNMIVCSRSGPKGKRCQVVEPPIVDKAGVLHYPDDEDRAAAKPVQETLF